MILRRVGNPQSIHENLNWVNNSSLLLKRFEVKSPKNYNYSTSQKIEANCFIAFCKEWYSLLRCQRVKNESVSYLRFDGHFSLVFCTSNAIHLILGIHAFSLHMTILTHTFAAPFLTQNNPFIFLSCVTFRSDLWSCWRWQLPLPLAVRPTRSGHELNSILLTSLGQGSV